MVDLDIHMNVNTTVQHVRLSTQYRNNNIKYFASTTPSSCQYHLTTANQLYSPRQAFVVYNAYYSVSIRLMIQILIIHGYAVTIFTLLSKTRRTLRIMNAWKKNESMPWNLLISVLYEWALHLSGKNVVRPVCPSILNHSRFQHISI